MVSSSVVTGRLPDALELAPACPRTDGTVNSVWTAVRTANGPDADAHVERGVDAVRVALLLPQQRVQARPEQPAQQAR